MNCAAIYTYLLKERVPHAQNPRRPASSQRMAVASVQSDWRILRTLWNFLNDEELLLNHQRKFFVKGRVPCPQAEEELRPVCPAGTVAALLDACASDDPEEEWRNRTILLLLIETGMRISELCGPRGLRDKDISLVNRWACVRGKGGRLRWVYWTEEAGFALAMYLEHRRAQWCGGSRRRRGSIWWRRRRCIACGMPLPTMDSRRGLTGCTYSSCSGTGMARRQSAMCASTRVSCGGSMTATTGGGCGDGCGDDQHTTGREG